MIRKESHLPRQSVRPRTDGTFRRKYNRWGVLIIAMALAATSASLSSASTAVGAGMQKVSTSTQSQCQAMASVIDLPDGGPVKVTKTEVIPGAQGSWQHIPDTSGFVPEHCEVVGEFATGTGFRVLLPLQGWNRDFFMQGCGGDCGDALLPSYQPLMDYALSEGFAVAWTNLHPEPKAGTEPGSWAYNNREIEYDFFPRATHNTTVAAKQLISKFYKEALRNSYFQGNSTGGRNALIAVQRYPLDYDGVLAGAPGIAPGGIPGIWNALANIDANGKNIMTAEKLPMLAKAVMKSCDTFDGLRDGVIEDPRNCDFKPSDITCKAGADKPTCLTSEQAKVISKFYETPNNSQGDLLPGGNVLGSELEWSYYFSKKAGTSVRDDPSGAYSGSTQRLRYLTFEDDPGPGYFPEDFDFETDIPRLAFMEAIRNQPSNPDLSAFRDAGGKLIMYQGWADQSVTPVPTIDYYEKITRAMGGGKKAQKFARFFLIPGKNHSSFDPGGSGANTVDWLPLLTKWVEKDKGPDKIVGENAERGFSRTFYPFPLTSRWNGKGDVNEAKNWISVKAKRK